MIRRLGLRGEGNGANSGEDDKHPTGARLESYLLVRGMGDIPVLTPALSHPMGEGARLVRRSSTGEGGRAGEGHDVANPAA